MINEPSRATPRYLSDLFRNGTPAALSDTELLNRFASRRSERDETAELAFVALLARHGPMVLRVCRGVLGDRHEVEDAFQATFLVLAIRAGSIRRRGSVASWLHGVALRVAASERARAARRRRYELVRAAMASSTTQDAGSDPVCDYELTRVVQEEIGRLPEKYRAAVVLCYLEGLTHEMAAEHLGWPLGSVNSRLAWARERLRVRLIRRGVAPTSLRFDRAGSSRDAESAPVPVLLGTRLVDATLCGALKAGLGREAMVGIVSSEAIALMEGIIKSMTTARLFLMAASVVVAALLTAGAGVMAYSVTQQQKTAPPRNPGQTDHQPAAAAQVTQGPPRPAAPKAATDQGPLMIQVQVVDPEGRRLSGAVVAMRVRYEHGPGNIESILEQTRTDGAGQVHLEVGRERPGAIVALSDVWAYQPGRAIATTAVSLRGKASLPMIQLTLDQPAKWTITVLGPDDQPVAGLRLTPHSFTRTDRRTASPTVLDVSLEEPLTVTTDADGAATLASLPGNMPPLSIRVVGPGVAPHTLPLDVPQGKNAVLKLGRSGRVVGIVRTASGAPLVNVPVELWVQGSGTLPSDLLPSSDPRVTSDEVVQLDQEPLKTGLQGSFQTPSALLSGLTYRVSIRHDGFVPFVSDWVTLNGDRAAIPAIRLQPLVQLTGRIKDRQGRPVAGARVFLPAGGPANVADAEGRFALAGINPGKTVILVEQTGFRLQGWLVDRSSRAEVGSLTLVRAGEISWPVMKPLADPIPPEESRALADRLLEPYLRDPMENDNDEPRLAAISALSEFDLDRSLELLQVGSFRNEDRRYQNIRESIAAKLAVKDPARAEAMVESIPDRLTKVSALSGVAKALPASERGRKQALLERATTLLRDGPQRANEASRLRLVSAIAEQWLDMGERDRARLVLQEAKISSDVFPASFLSQLARLEPDQALARSQKLPNLQSDPTYRDFALATVAVELATDHPAEAEQVFNLWVGSNSQFLPLQYALRLCRRLARVDPPRARRVAASFGDPGTRARAWAFVALGLAEKDKAGASAALDRAIQEIDRLRESGPVAVPVPAVSGIYTRRPTNPAAQILPVVERIAPDRLAEVFWRAVALHPLIETEPENLLGSPYIDYECIMLARYDREVAATLFEPMDAYLHALAARKGHLWELEYGVITAKACIDPRAAVGILESLTPPRELRRSNRPDRARPWLAEVLGLPSKDRWMRLWHYMKAQLDD